MTMYKAQFAGEIASVDDLRNHTGTTGKLSGNAFVDNTLRARWAAEALVVFADRTGPGEPLETVVGDLLADMRHLCDALGISFRDAMNHGAYHYRSEIHGEL